MKTLTNVLDAAVTVDVVDVAIAHRNSLAPSKHNSDLDTRNTH
jgi:hypothetical protein